MSKKHKEVEAAAERVGMLLYGRSRHLARAGHQCVSCGKAAGEFRDDLSRREYELSLFCQVCQDNSFGGIIRYDNPEVMRDWQQKSVTNKELYGKQPEQE